MTDSVVTLGVEQGLATITLARPEANNAMSAEFIDRFALAAAAIAADPAVRAVLIESQGKNFCVGGDIQAFASESDPSGYIRNLARRLHDGVLSLARLPAPVVVAVQGAAAGAGLSLVAGGDVVIGARSSSYAMAYTGIGLTADGGATWLLPRLIGLRRTQEMAYLGRRLTAEEAERDGLITRVVADEALAEEARAVARKLAAGPTHAFGAVKRLLAEAQEAGLPPQLDRGGRGDRGGHGHRRRARRGPVLPGPRGPGVQRPVTAPSWPKEGLLPTDLALTGQPLPVFTEPVRAPHGPVPLRRAGSVRRTMSIDVRWPEGRLGTAQYLCRCRDVLSDDPAAPPTVLDEAEARVAIAGREIVAIAAHAGPARPAGPGRRARRRPPAPRPGGGHGAGNGRGRPALPAA